jgi:hypothetical protein
MLLALALALGSPTLHDAASPEPFARPAPIAPQGIVGGAPAAPGSWPDVVAIFTINQVFGCTGTLIAPDLVLTAGHCGAGMETILVGTHDLRDGGERFAIAETFVYPDYFSTYDVAVYRLDRPVVGVTPRPLLRDCRAGQALVEGADAWIVGWGDIDTLASVSTDVLHEALTPIDDPVCADLTRACQPNVSPGGELIAGGGGVDSCNGDSGGPLFVDTPDGRVLAGVTSRAAEPTTLPCGDGGIYARADAVADWIEQATGASLFRPDCEGVNVPPVPLAGEIRGYRGGPAVGQRVHPNDDNVDQRWSFRVVEPPAFGRAWLDGDLLVVAPPRSTFGDTEVVVEVTDDGDPPLSASVTVPVRVDDVEVVGGGTSCDTVAGRPWALAFVAAGLSWRRARRCLRRCAPESATGSRSAG